MCGIAFRNQILRLPDIFQMACLNNVSKQEIAPPHLSVEDGHLCNMGKMIEELEGKLRNQLDQVYFGKTKEMVCTLRPPSELLSMTLPDSRNPQPLKMKIEDGEHIAYEYAKRCASVAIIAIKEPGSRLEQVADRARQLRSPDVLFVFAEVSNVEECRLFVNHTIKHFGRLDHLVCNAGIGPLYSNKTEVTRFEPVMRSTCLIAFICFSRGSCMKRLTMASNNQIVSILATGAKTSSKSMPCSGVGGVIGPHKSPYSKSKGEDKADVVKAPVAKDKDKADVVKDKTTNVVNDKANVVKVAVATDKEKADVVKAPVSNTRRRLMW
nr:11-beta-hydroxysteroid dehydrogenase-like 4A [Tanacetum cinerariifolium]